MPRHGYTAGAIALHWAVALMVFALLGLGWYMDDLPEGVARSASIQLHKSIGISVFLLMLIRVLWRLSHRPPPLNRVPGWQIRLARSNHCLMYVLLFVQPLSGYLSSSFSGYPTQYAGIELPHWGWRDEALNDLFSTVHQINSKVLAALIVLHILGALTHLLVYRDSVVRRMLPWNGAPRE
ncbi:cytochrome b [soil metagenome]